MITPEEIDLRRRRRSRSAAITFQNAGGAVFGSIAMQCALAGLLRRLLLHARRPMWTPAGLQRWARRLGIGERPGIDLPRRAAGPAADPEMAQRALPRKAAPTGPGRRATTSTSRSARATCRRTRCRWRSPTRRSPTAARCHAPRRHAGRGRGRPGAAGDRPAAARQGRDRPGVPAGDPRTACTTPPSRRTAPPTTSSAASRSPVAGKTGTAERPALRRPVLVRGAGALSRPRDRRRRDLRAGRLRRRHGRAGRARRSSPSTSTSRLSRSAGPTGQPES